VSSSLHHTQLQHPYVGHGSTYVDPCTTYRPIDCCGWPNAGYFLQQNSLLCAFPFTSPYVKTKELMVRGGRHNTIRYIPIVMTCRYFRYIEASVITVNDY